MLREPHHMALTPDHRSMVIGDTAGNTLFFLDPHTGAILGGALLFVLALGMLTAAPFIGQVPFGIAVCLSGLGSAEGDGLLVVTGMVAGTIGAALSASFLYALFLGIQKMI